MKKKVLLKSLAVMMSLLTLSPYFGNLTFAMKKRECVLESQKRKNEDKLLTDKILSEINRFVEMFKELDFIGHESDCDKLVNFYDKITKDKLIKSYLNGAKKWSEIGDIEKIRIAMYSILLAYLLKKNNFDCKETINLETFDLAVINCNKLIRDIFVIFDLTLKALVDKIDISRSKSLNTFTTDVLAELRSNIFKEDGKHQGQNYNDGQINSYEELLKVERSYLDCYNKSRSCSGNIQSIYTFFLLKRANLHLSSMWKDKVATIQSVFQFLFELFQTKIMGINHELNKKLDGSGIMKWYQSVDSLRKERDKEKTELNKKLSAFLKNTLKECERVKLVENIKKQQPEVEAKNKEQEQQRAEEKERSRNTKPNVSNGIVNVNYSMPGVFIKDEEEQKEERIQKSISRCQAAEIAENLEKEKEREKEEEKQKKQEEINNQYERQRLPDSLLSDEQIDDVFNNIHADNSKGVYTRIFMAGEDGAKNSVYFPFQLFQKINDKYEKEDQRDIFKKDLKRTIYNISRVEENFFNSELHISMIDKKTNGYKKFKLNNYTENVKTLIGLPQSANIYKFTPAGSLKNKDRIAFVKNGNSILVFDFLDHIGGKK